jgi:hypothetical protein
MSLKALLDSMIEEEEEIVFVSEKKHEIILDKNEKKCEECNVHLTKKQNEYVCPDCYRIYNFYDSESIADEAFIIRKVRTQDKTSLKLERFLDTVSLNFSSILGDDRLSINMETKRLFDIIVKLKIKRSSCRLGLLGCLFQTVSQQFSHHISGDQICLYFIISKDDLEQQISITRSDLSEQQKNLENYIQSNLFNFSENNSIEKLKQFYPMKIDASHDKDVLVLVHTYRSIFVEQKDNSNLWIFIYRLTCLLLKSQFFVCTSNITKILAIVQLIYNFPKFYLSSLGITTTAYRKVTKKMREYFKPLLSHSTVTMKKVKRIRRLFKNHGFIDRIDN